ncbi:MAG TPA: NAD(P)/FAD-dependent oxidoreductase [Myxococcota bacterium]|nr:NAD(P)/FAD-dependent oxidoreductase [Myxococcota bacterium]
MRLDAAILGGGVAGNLLARQLRLALPGLRVGLFEKSTERSYKVGESSVEISAAYFVRRVQLSRYLYHEHLPKNGLRYFFDTPAHDAELAAMSEMGTVAMPFHPAFQIDRARFEQDLLRMNAEDGVETRVGARVQSIELGRGGAPHRFEVVEDGARRKVETRWLLDASGRTSLVAKKLGLRVPEPSHFMASAWGRFEGVADIDTMGSVSWRERVRFTNRGLSTVHFCYPGYWVWFIPLRNDVTSVGVTGERARLEALLREHGGLRGFLESHRAIASLLAPAKQLDEGRYAQIAYGTKRFVSPDRWAVVGEAAAAQDPLYSPGIDLICLANDLVGDLVVRDAAGETGDALAERFDLYERFLQFRHEAVMRVYRGLYGVLGSFELMRLKWELDLPSYYNLWVTPFMLERHLDPAFLREQLRWQPLLFRALGNFAALFRETEQALWRRGEYYRANLGEFYDSVAPVGDLMRDVGLARTRRDVLKRQQATFNHVRAATLDLLAGRPSPRPSIPLTAFFSERPYSADLALGEADAARC